MNRITLFLVFIFPFSLLAQQAKRDLTNDYYDNRDNNHANMPIAPHPGLSYMSSGYSYQTQVIQDTIVFGNASLAYTSGLYWGSLNRVGFLRSPNRMGLAYNLYINNNAYWYPEHHDHDDVDYYFSQAPFLNNSQGSSGSEIDELHKWFYTLDAFDVNVKNYLKSNHLIVPTMQMIARRSRVNSDAEYLSGIAHPNAFDNADVRTTMENMASGMSISTVPPMVQIEVLQDDYNAIQEENNFWFFEPVLYPLNQEDIHQTPVSISRIWHTLEYTKKIVVSAQNSYDLNNLPLTYHWTILRGDPSEITINPLNTEGSIVEILINHHNETTIPNQSRLTNLVSIGVFVHNGHYYSAPAFVTSYTKRNETRYYNAVTKKIDSIVYNNNYIDPYLSNTKDWDKDIFLYDTNGDFNGWNRYKGNQQNSFTKEGYVVEQTDSNGNITMVSKVTYQLNNNKSVWVKVGSPFPYDSSSGIYDVKPQKYLHIYPNPIIGDDELHINFTDCAQFKRKTVEICNLKGQLIKEIKIKNCKTKINLTELKSSVYILKIKDDKAYIQIKKLIKL